MPYRRFMFAGPILTDVRTFLHSLVSSTCPTLALATPGLRPPAKFEALRLGAAMTTPSPTLAIRPQLGEKRPRRPRLVGERVHAPGNITRHLSL